MSSSDTTPAPPEALALAGRAAKTFLDAGAAAWATMSGTEIAFAGEAPGCARAGEWLKDLPEGLVTELQWSGDHAGRMFFVLEPAGAKAVVAHMMALMMGGTAEPENTRLDSDGMDAYSEAVNNLAGQGAQALRGELGGAIKLAVVSTQVANLSDPAALAGFGDVSMLGIAAKLRVGPGTEAAARWFLEPDCLGVALAAAAATDPVDAVAAVTPDGEDFPEDNLIHALSMKVPLVVILAERRMRMEMIQEMAPGTIIEFHKQSGDPMDVYANNVRIATAEVVTTNQHFGVQIQSIVDPRQAPPV